MRVMKPIFTFNTLYHKIMFDFFVIFNCGHFAITINIKKGLIINILIVLMVFLII